MNLPLERIRRASEQFKSQFSNNNQDQERANVILANSNVHGKMRELILEEIENNHTTKDITSPSSPQRTLFSPGRKSLSPTRTTSSNTLLSCYTGSPLKRRSTQISQIINTGFHDHKLQELLTLYNPEEEETTKTKEDKVKAESVHSLPMPRSKTLYFEY